MALDLEAFRRRLIAQRDALLAQDAMSEGDRAPVALDQDSVGRLSRIDAMQLQAMAVAQQQRRQAERATIDAALERIEAGEFGYCVRCGEEIAPARIEHNPAASTCIDCAREG
jgi:DnaK suppressor protein